MLPELRVPIAGRMRGLRVWGNPMLVNLSGFDAAVYIPNELIIGVCASVVPPPCCLS